MDRKGKETKATGVQKFFMGITGCIVLFSFIMVVLSSWQVYSEPDTIYRHILFSSLSAMFGFLFGNNARMQLNNVE